MRRQMGSETLARSAEKAVWGVTSGPHNWSDADLIHAIDKAGFEFLGRGSTRIAVVGPDGVVYKVSTYDDCHVATRAEIRFFDSASEQPWVPDYWAYGDTIAMQLYRPYALGSNADKAALHALIEETYDASVYDIDDYNVAFRSDGSIVLIDGGANDLECKDELVPA